MEPRIRYAKTNDPVNIAYRTLSILAMALSALLIAGCGDDGDNDAIDVSSPSVAERLEQAVDAAANDLKISGVAVEVIDADGHRLSSTSGVDAGTMFGIASITKMFTTVTVLRLAERGVVDLDAAVTLPGLEEGASLRDLLGHTAGLPYDALLVGPRWTDADFERAASALHPCRPRECFAYSDLGFVGVGLVIERATGEPFADVLDREILTPLGLHSSVLTTLDSDIDHVALPDGLPLGPPGPLAGVPVNTWTGGSMVTTAAELATFARALFDGQLLEPASLAEMMDVGRNEALPCDPKRCVRPYGLGLESYFHSGVRGGWGHGASTGAQVVRLSGEEITVAIVTTRQGTGEELYDRVIEAIAGQ